MYLQVYGLQFPDFHWCATCRAWGGFTGKTASADMSGQHTMKSYENVLIKSGDTLSSLADTYAEKYSNLSKAEYEEAIISLNSLSSENIHAGGYLLLPNFK